MIKAIKGNKIYEINFFPWRMAQMNVDDFFKKKSHHLKNDLTKNHENSCWLIRVRWNLDTERVLR